MKKLNRVEARDYQEMSQDKPLDTLRERYCFKFLLEHLPEQPREVLELFGGIGLLSEVMKDRGYLTGLKYHEAWDHSEQCVELLTKKNPNCCVRLVNSFKEPIPPKKFDFISADFNTWTFLKYSREVLYYKVTNRIFREASVWVQLADSAVNKLHLNFRAYAKEFGCDPEECNTPLGYFQQLNKYAQTEWKFGLVAIAFHFGAASYLFKRGYSGSEIAVKRIKEVK